MAHLWLTSFAYRSPGQAFSDACPECVGQSLTANVVDYDTANLSYTYSRGYVNIGFYDSATGNTLTATGGTTKSSGNQTPDTLAGSTAGGTICDQGWITVNALVPTQGTGPLDGHHGWKTDITVYLNGVALGTVSSGESPIGQPTAQTFTYTRSENDQIHVVYGSSAEFIKLLNTSTLNINGSLGAQAFARPYVIQPVNEIAYLGAIPPQFNGSNISFSVDTVGKTLDVELNTPVPTSNILGTVFLYHNGNPGKSVSLDINYSAPSGGGGGAPKGGTA